MQLRFTAVDETQITDTIIKLAQDMNWPRIIVLGHSFGSIMVRMCTNSRLAAELLIQGIYPCAGHTHVHTHTCTCERVHSSSVLHVQALPPYPVAHASAMACVTCASALFTSYLYIATLLCAGIVGRTEAAPAGGRLGNAGPRRNFTLSPRCVPQFCLS